MSGEAADSVLAKQAKWSWQFPLWAWASQVLMIIIFRDVHGPIIGIAHLLAALGQAGLIFGGLGLGAWVLVRARGDANRPARRAAIAGIVLSGGTLLLIAVVAVLALLGG